MLQGKIAVITGASRGIGKAIAERFASEGAFVIINYNGSKEHAQEVKREILEHRGNAEIMQCNVADLRHARHLSNRLWINMEELMSL